MTSNQQQLDRPDPDGLAVLAAFMLASLGAAAYFAYCAAGALALGLPAVAG